MRKQLFISAAIVSMIHVSGFAQESEVDPLANALEALYQEMPASDSAGLVVPPPASSQAMEDDTTRALMIGAWRAVYEYQISGFEHRKKVFAWQLFSSRIIFFSVLVLVFVGICFSGIQFYKSILPSGKKETLEPAESSQTGGSPVSSEVEFSVKGIKVTSPVLGVIILVISLAFFYLYLVYVYPIQEIF